MRSCHILCSGLCDVESRICGQLQRRTADERPLVFAEGAIRLVDNQTWSYPSRADCFRCCTDLAGYTLGLEVGQLSQPVTYPATGRSARQMETLARIELLNQTAVTGPLPVYPSYGAPDATEAERAKAYLHANCANCHRPGGPTFTRPDLRSATSLADMDICDVLPTISDLDGLILDNPRPFAPAGPSQSSLYVRMTTEDDRLQMPPLARSITDPIGNGFVFSWISNTLACQSCVRIQPTQSGVDGRAEGDRPALGVKPDLPGASHYVPRSVPSGKFRSEWADLWLPAGHRPREPLQCGVEARPAICAIAEGMNRPSFINGRTK